MVTGIPEKVRNRALRQVGASGRACVYLCSRVDDYITGAELSINGSLFM
jgi:hypothetical protein